MDASRGHPGIHNVKVGPATSSAGATWWILEPLAIISKLGSTFKLVLLYAVNQLLALLNFPACWTSSAEYSFCAHRPYAQHCLLSSPSFSVSLCPSSPWMGCRSMHIKSGASPLISSWLNIQAVSQEAEEKAAKKALRGVEHSSLLALTEQRPH